MGAPSVLTYDDEDRLKTTSGPIGAQTYTYNGFDTRVGKTVGGSTTSYHRDGTGVTAPLISDSNATYTPGISERRNGVSTFLNSGLKDVAKQTDAAGSVTATRKYDAYGMVIGSTGTWKGPFGYSGSAGYQEDETGLQLLGHRYYDPSIGRFITRDPIKDGRNWYAYCDNNPINAIDADGLEKWLLFDGEWLILMDGNKEIARTPAASGNPGTDASMQNRPSDGPLPEGDYYIDPSEDAFATNNPFSWLGSGYPRSGVDGWGERRIPIHPEPGTITYGRSGFFLHGGKFIGSHGCIDIGHADVRWIDWIGKQKKRIKLKVKYKNKKGRASRAKLKEKWKEHPVRAGGMREALPI